MIGKMFDLFLKILYNEIIFNFVLLFYLNRNFRIFANCGLFLPVIPAASTEAPNRIFHRKTCLQAPH